MGITDELREWASIEVPHKYGRQLSAIADRIDQRVAELLREQDADYRAEIDLLNDERADGWIELPKDADGLPIHIGDKVTLYSRCVYEVDAIFFYENGVSVSYEGESGCGCDSANNFHHYHEPTIEGVLHNFICDVEEGVRDEREIIAEYAAKLRLADGGKEQ